MDANFHYSDFATITKSFTAEADLQAKTVDPICFTQNFEQLLTKNLCLNICLKIGLGRETFSSKITKVSVKSCGKLSNRVEHYFAGRTTTMRK